MTDERKTCDPRGPRGRVVGVAAAVEKFRSEVPEGQLAVNLGCGQTHLDGFVNVDWMPDEAVDVSFDVFGKDWPFADGSVGFVYMSHLLEHLPGDKWATFWNEMWRVCAEGARVMIMSPHAHSNRYLQDPTHCQPIIEAKFQYLSKAWRESNKLNHNYYGCKELNFLQDIKSWKNWNGDYAMREDTVKQWSEIHENNVIDDIIVFLKAFKSDAALEAYMRVIEAQMNGQEAQGKTIEV